MNIDRALADKNLLGASIGDLTSWKGWLTVLRAAFGLGLGESELEFFKSIAGDRNPPQTPVSELWCVCGRRSGKSRMAAALAVYAAIFEKHKLASGETGFVLCLSATRAQAKLIFGYCLGFLESAPLLERKIRGVTADEIRLAGGITSGITISVLPNSFRSIRGRTIVACVFDETAYWDDSESANPDIETARAVAPALAASRGRLIAISSPYRRQGLLFERHKAYFGQDDPDVLVIQAGSTNLNPTLDPRIVARAEREDPEAAAAEWHGQFRDDIANYVSRTAVERCIDKDTLERPYVNGNRYRAFVDPAGGSGGDSMTLAISHREKFDDVDIGKLDVLREIHPPFSPQQAVEQFCNVLREYRVSHVTGDRFAGQFCQEQFRFRGFGYQPSEKSKSDIYCDFLPLVNSDRVRLLDDGRLIKQLCALERRTSRAGKDSIDHPPAGHDDLVNVAAGSLVNSVVNVSYMRVEPLIV